MNGPRSTGVYVVEDHPVMREMLSETIERLPALRFCGAAASGEEALEALPAAAEVDLVLVDLTLPRMSGMELIQAIRARHPALRTLMVSGHADPGLAAEAMENGARGYVLKGLPAELLEAIRVCAAGGRYVSERLREREASPE